MASWKSSIILKEIKKPSGNLLRDKAKNKWRFEIFRENFKIYIWKSQWKIDFLPIFYPIFLGLCHFKQLWKTAPFSTILLVSGELPLAGAPGNVVRDWNQNRLDSTNPYDLPL